MCNLISENVGGVGGGERRGSSLIMSNLLKWICKCDEIKRLNMILKILPPCDTLEREKDEETIAVFVVKLNTCVRVGVYVCHFHLISHDNIIGVEKRVRKVFGRCAWADWSMSLRLVDNIVL